MTKIVDAMRPKARKRNGKVRFSNPRTVFSPMWDISKGFRWLGLHSKQGDDSFRKLLQSIRGKVLLAWKPFLLDFHHDS